MTQPYVPDADLSGMAPTSDASADYLEDLAAAASTDAPGLEVGELEPDPELARAAWPPLEPWPTCPARIDLAANADADYDGPPVDVPCGRRLEYLADGSRYGCPVHGELSRDALLELRALAPDAAGIGAPDDGPVTQTFTATTVDELVAQVRVALEARGIHGTELEAMLAEARATAEANEAERLAAAAEVAALGLTPIQRTVLDLFTMMASVVPCHYDVIPQPQANGERAASIVFGKPGGDIFHVALDQDGVERLIQKLQRAIGVGAIIAADLSAMPMSEGPPNGANRAERRQWDRDQRRRTN